MAFTPGKGTVIQATVSASLTSIPQVTSITAPSQEMGSVETTHLTSTARTFQATIFDGAEVTFTMEFDPADATQEDVYTQFKAGTADAWKIVYADSGAEEVSFTAFVTNYQIDEASVDNIVTVSVTLKVTGDVTMA